VESAAPRPRPPAVDPRLYRDAVGRFPTGVTVVTTRLDGRDHGMTVSSFTSVSLDPVLVLVSIEHAARLHDVILAAGRWAVSVLPAHQEEVSRLFARRGRPEAEVFAAVAHIRGPLTGAALIDGALATIECRTAAAYPGGDHTILLGEVLGLGVGDPGASPLVYHRGEYRGSDR